MKNLIARARTSFSKLISAVVEILRSVGNELHIVVPGHSALKDSPLDVGRVIPFSMTVRSTLVVLFRPVTYFCFLGLMLGSTASFLPCWPLMKFNLQDFRARRNSLKLRQSIRLNIARHLRSGLRLMLSRRSQTACLLFTKKGTASSFR